MIKLSIIIVSWNTAKETLAAVRSIFRFLDNKINFEVVVVDNASNDETVAELENLITSQNLDNLIIIQNSDNLGFAKANNIGLKKATGDLILFLNPDTELKDDTLLGLIQFLESKEGEKIGAVGPRLLNTDGTLQRSCRQFPKLADQFFIQLKLHNFFPNKIKSIKQYYMFDFEHDELKEVDQIMGAAMLIPRHVLDEVGVFDEGYTRIFEEVDLCQRIKQAGCKIFFYPDCEIYHHKGVSFSQVKKIRKQINFNKCLHRYFRKHEPVWQLMVLYILWPFNIALTFIDLVFNIRRLRGKDKGL